MHPLDGCRVKIDRARFHIDEMKESIRVFIDRSPFKVQAEIHGEPPSEEAVFVAEANPEFEGVPLGITLIAGEVVHQLRSALDHLVWQLVVVNTGQAPQGTKSGFPIFRDAAGYAQRAQAMIVGVSAQASARIEAAQPFHAGADAEKVVTWALHELSNTDKHRMIPATTTYTFVGHVRLIKSDGSITDILAPQEEVREPLHDGMEIARVPIADGMEGANFDIPLGFDVAFEQVGGVIRHPATSFLIQTTKYVSDLIESFRGEFP
jgi:hypothetical protein